MTTINYDPGGRKLGMQDADMGTWSYGYDALGNLLTQSDARGCTTTLGYDGRGRMASESKTVTGGGVFVTQWSYNPDDSPASMTYPDGEVVNYTYNAQKLVETVDGQDTYVLATQYDAAKRILNRTLGNGVRNEYGYYAWQTPGGSGRLQQAQSRAGNGQGALLQALSYQYDLVGNPLQIEDGVAQQVQHFAYDDLYRLVSADATGEAAQGGYSESYSYDALTGNLASKAGVSYAYDDPAHRHAVTGLDGETRYGYDANGNMTQRTVWITPPPVPPAAEPTETETAVPTEEATPTETATPEPTATEESTATPEGEPTGEATPTPEFTPTETPTPTETATPTEMPTETIVPTETAIPTETATPTATAAPVLASYTLIYDAENRLVQAQKDGASVAQYVFDGDGQRVQAVVGGVTTTYVGAHYEQETDGTTATVRKYYSGGAMRQNGEVFYLLSDHLGGTNLTLDTAGNKVAELRYRAWGETRFSQGSTPTTYRYTGQREASEIGLYFYNARWYDSSLGRFAQADTVIPNPVNSTDWNRYTYVQNSPVVYTDPSGHRSCEERGTCESLEDFIAIKSKEYGIRFEGKWKLENMAVVMRAVIDAGVKFTSTSSTLRGLGSAQAFRTVFKNGMTFVWGNEGAPSFCSGDNGFNAGGCAASSSKIYFATLLSIPTEYRSAQDAFINAKNNVMHELGHAFSDLWYHDANKDGKAEYNDNGPLMNIPSKLLNEKGFLVLKAPNAIRWRQHPGDHSSSEIFADMFLAWSYEGGEEPTWAPGAEGQARSDFMQEQMQAWINNPGN